MTPADDAMSAVMEPMGSSVALTSPTQSAVRRSARGFALTVGDQALSSCTNFAVLLISARQLGPSRFAPVGLALAVAVLAMTVGRSLAGEPALAVLPPLSPSDSRRVVGGGLGLVVGLGLALAAAIGVVQLAGSHLVSMFGLTAVFIPFVLTQDFLRYVSFARRRPLLALRSDAVWFAMQFAVLGPLIAAGSDNARSFVLAWGAGAVAACLLAGWSLAGLSEAARWHQWFHAAGDYPAWLFGQNAVSQLGLQSILFVIGALLGSAALGGYRAMQVLAQPATAALVAAVAFVVPALTTALQHEGPAGVLARVKRYTFATVVILVPTLLVAIASSRVARIVYGTHYVKYSDVLRAIAVAFALQVVAMPALSGLRAMRDGRGLFVAQVCTTLVSAGGAAAAAALAGLTEAAWAYAAGSLVLAIVAWARLFSNGRVTRPVQ